MSEHFDWWMGGPDDEQRRELEHLRSWKEAVLWLVKNAPTTAWRRGVRKAAQAPTGRKVPLWADGHGLIAYVQGAMPKREPTPAEAAELERLLPLTGFSPEGQAWLRERAAENPAWHLFMLERFVRDDDSARTWPI